MDKTLADAILVANEAGLTDRDLAAMVEAATDYHRNSAAVAAAGSVTMVHPALPGEEHHVTPEALEVYAQSGWTVKPASEPAVDPGDPPDETPPADDDISEEN
jgi:hypothetical protein